MWQFSANGVEVSLGQTNADGLLALGASGPAPPADGALEAAAAARSAARARLVEDARGRMRPTLARLDDARHTLAEARAEEGAANEALADAKRELNRALQSARNPGPFRKAVTEAEQRAQDALEWVRHAQSRAQSAEANARAEASAAWGGAVADARAAVEGRVAATAEEVRGHLAGILAAALGVYPELDAVRGSGVEDVIAEAVEAAVPALKLAAG